MLLWCAISAHKSHKIIHCHFDALCFNTTLYIFCAIAVICSESRHISHTPKHRNTIYGWVNVCSIAPRTANPAHSVAWFHFSSDLMVFRQRAAASTHRNRISHRECRWFYGTDRWYGMAVRAETQAPPGIRPFTCNDNRQRRWRWRRQQNVKQLSEQPVWALPCRGPGKHREPVHWARQRWVNIYIYVIYYTLCIWIDYGRSRIRNVCAHKFRCVLPEPARV